jgi:hypothetical protein
MTLNAPLTQHIEAMQRLVPTGPDQIGCSGASSMRREQFDDDGIRRRLRVTRLPDFWSNQKAVKEFEETFFASLAYSAE